MNLNYLNNISLLKLAGINKFICVDIHSNYIKFSCLKRREPLYKIQSEVESEDIEIVASSVHQGNDIGIIEKIIKSLALEHSFNDAVIIAGINDYKYSTLQIPADTEDIELWFSENGNKFLPEGRSADDFTFSYELYKQDENVKNYIVIIARTNNIEAVYNACSMSGLTTICLFPFIFSALSLFDGKKSLLLLNMENDRVSYLFKSSDENIVYQEKYLNYYWNNNESPELIENNIDNNSLQHIIDEIKQSIILAVGSQSAEDMTICISCKQENYITISSQVKKLFDSGDIYSKYSSGNNYFILSVFAAREIINNYNTSLNILRKSKSDTARESIEKQAGLRIVFGSGIFIIVLLLFAFVGEKFLNDRIEEQETLNLKAAAKVENFKQLKKENGYLKANIELLSKLKGNRVEYSSLLYDITKIINYGSCLSNLKLNENEEKYIFIELTGITESQRTLAEFMSNMEESQKFKDISLVYSKLLKESSLAIQSEIVEESYISFKMTAKYDAYSK